MIPPHLFYQIYLSFLEQNDCTPPKCGELSEYTDSAHTEVEDPSSRCLNQVRNIYVILLIQITLTNIFRNNKMIALISGTIVYLC